MITELPQFDWSTTAVGLKGFFHSRKAELCTEPELARLRELEVEWREFQRQLGTVNVFEPSRRLDAARAAYQAEPCASTFAKMQKLIEGRDEVIAEVRATRHVIKVALTRWFREQCLPAVLRPLQRACELGREFCEELQLREQAESIDCGLEVYVPSDTLTRCRARVRQIESNALAIAEQRFNGLSSPSGMLADILTIEG